MIAFSDIDPLEKDVAKDFTACWNRGEIEAFAFRIDKEAVYTRTGRNEPIQGRENVIQALCEIQEKLSQTSDNGRCMAELGTYSHDFSQEKPCALLVEKEDKPLLAIVFFSIKSGKVTEISVLPGAMGEGCVVRSGEFPR